MRFRGTLAARVALLVTVAVGLAVTCVATAAYLTVRHQLTASLDEMLLRDIPSPMNEAADVRIGVIYDGTSTWEHDFDTASSFVWRPTSAEHDVALGRTEHSVRTIYTPTGPYRLVAVPGER